MKKYILFSSIVSVALLLVFYLLNGPALNGFLHPWFQALVIFFFVQSFPIAWMLSEGEKDRSRFAIFALGSVTFRFVSGVLFLVVFFIAGVDRPEALTVQFVGVYLVYLVFELFVVLANLRRN